MTNFFKKKKQILCLVTMLFLFGCATTKEYEPIPLIEDHPYRHIDLYMKGLPKITVIVPDYAVDYIHDRDQSFVVHLSKNIVMLYFNKNPELMDRNDLGHAVAIIFDASRGYLPLLFQTTIQEEQRFFYYAYDYDSFPFDEITKPVYRNYLQFLISRDKNKNKEL